LIVSSIRVLIVDDHPVLRRGLRSLLSSYSDIEVVGEGENAATALQAAQDSSPNIILLDIHLPGPNGIEIAHQLRKQVPEAKIIILSAFDNKEYVLETLRAGAYAYLLKNTSDETVVEAIRAVHQGKHLLAPSLMDTVLKHFEILSQVATSHEVGLTDQEIHVLKLLADGASSREIGEKLYWSERTVKRRVEEIIEKLGARNRAEAVAHAIKKGII
jgi:two-component system, NarL family, response regulator DevR